MLTRFVPILHLPHPACFFTGTASFVGRQPPLSPSSKVLLTGIASYLAITCRKAVLLNALQTVYASNAVSTVGSPASDEFYKRKTGLDCNIAKGWVLFLAPLGAGAFVRPLLPHSPRGSVTIMQTTAPTACPSLRGSTTSPVPLRARSSVLARFSPLASPLSGESAMGFYNDAGY